MPFSYLLEVVLLLTCPFHIYYARIVHFFIGVDFGTWNTDCLSRSNAIRSKDQQPYMSRYARRPPAPWVPVALAFLTASKPLTNNNHLGIKLLQSISYRKDQSPGAME